MRLGLVSPEGRGLAVPGFVDLQVNGFGGVDFLDADADGYRRAGDALLETGVTAYLPTLITSPEEKLLAALAEVPTASRLSAHRRRPPGRAVPLPARLGTHDASARRDPDLATARPAPRRRAGQADDARAGASGRFRADRRACSSGMSPSRSATATPRAEQANAAFDLGVRTVTHLFNAMRPFLHRDPGIVGAALARDDVVVQLILDGVPSGAGDREGRVALGARAGCARHRRDRRRRRKRRRLLVRSARHPGPEGAVRGARRRARR